jgi:hypothetical protein
MPLPRPRSHRHPRLLLVVSAATLLALGTQRAVADDAAGTPLRPGVWAIQFEIDPDLTSGIGFSGGAALSGKRHFSDRSALRLSVGFSYEEGESDQEGNYGSSGPYWQDRLTTRESYFASLQWIRHFRTSDRTTVFLGAGPGFRYAHRDVDDTSTRSTSTWAYEASTTSRGATLDASLGFEWYFAKRVSLGAQSGAFLAYEWEDGSSRDEAVYTAVPSDSYLSTSHWEVDGFRVSTRRAVLMLSVYL